MSKGSCWSITINNPTASDYQEIANLQTQKWVKMWKGQVEQGEAEETTHIQGMLKTDYIRFSQVKKALTRAHIEKANNPAALSNYVEKEETRVGAIAPYKALLPSDIYKACQEEYETYEDLKTAYKDYLEEVEKKKLKDNFALGLLDDAVSELIKQGTNTIEFMCSNPSFRTAFKTYFLAIMYRQYASQVQEDSCPSTPPPSPS
jgi:Putative viral replication protein.